MVQVYSIGSANSGMASSSADALSATAAFTSTGEFRNAMRTPKERDEFISGLKLRQEKALANNNKTMFNFLGAIIQKAKSEIPEEDYGVSTTGTRFDSNKMFGI